MEYDMFDHAGMEDFMKNQKAIDFTKIDWKMVDQEKIKFFFKEARDFNNKLIDDIQNLNNKIFSLLALTLPIISATVGYLITVWGNKDKEPLSEALLCASGGLAISLCFSLLAIFPRPIFRGGGAPKVFFSGSWYKADMYTILSGGIASYHKFITRNFRTMKYRNFLLRAGIITFILTLPLTVLAFFLRYRTH
jgi:hypothetical protein